MLHNPDADFMSHGEHLGVKPIILMGQPAWYPNLVKYELFTLKRTLKRWGFT